MGEDGVDHLDRDGIAGLFAGLAVADDDFVAVEEALEAEHFAGGEAAFAIDEEVVVGGARAEGAGIWVGGDVSGLVFVPDGGLLLGDVAGAALGADVFGGVVAGIDLWFEDFREGGVVVVP